MTDATAISALLVRASTKDSVPRDLRTIDILTKVLAKELQSLLSESLDLRIQALPQELQDAILEFTIAVESADDGAIHINKDYKPPLGLQLNRKMRDEFARSYYGGDSIFYYDAAVAPLISTHRWGDPLITCYGLLREWLWSLNRSHRNSIKTIRLKRLVQSGKFAPRNPIWADNECARLRKYFGKCISAGVLVCYLETAEGRQQWYRSFF